MLPDHAVDKVCAGGIHDEIVPVVREHWSDGDLWM